MQEHLFLIPKVIEDAACAKRMNSLSINELCGWAL